jgi:hypothetical protein
MRAIFVCVTPARRSRNRNQESQEMSMRSRVFAMLLAGTLSPALAQASSLTFGDLDCLGLGCYGASNPTAGATLEGLAPGAITLATTGFGHAFPFAPAIGEFAGTDTIFVGSTQTGFHDGYSVSAPRVNGPQVLTLDYSSLVGPGQLLTTLTLGIAADDFQFPSFGQPFTARVNGVVNAALTAQLNAVDLGGPVVRFFTIGLNPAVDPGNHILTLSIDQGGDGGDGWAVDYLTVGATVTNAAVPEPSTWAMLALGLGGLAAAAARRSER